VKLTSLEAFSLAIYVIFLTFFSHQAKIHSSALYSIIPSFYMSTNTCIYAKLYSKCGNIVPSRHNSNTGLRVKTVLKQDIFSCRAGKVLASEEAQF